MENTKAEIIKTVSRVLEMEKRTIEKYLNYCRDEVIKTFSEMLENFRKLDNEFFACNMIFEAMSYEYYIAMKRK